MVSSLVLLGCVTFIIVASIIYGNSGKEKHDFKRINGSPSQQTKLPSSALLKREQEPKVVTRKQLAVAAISALNFQNLSDLEVKLHSSERGFEAFNVFYTRDDAKRFSYLVSSLGNEVSYMDVNGLQKWNENIRLYWSENVERRTLTIKTVFLDGSSDTKSFSFKQLNSFR